MGYYTQYDWVKDPSKAVLKWVSDNEDTDLSYALSVADQTKWYDHEKDMKELSLLFPDEVLSIEGVGEEQPDTWRKHFKNGEVRACQASINFPDPVW